MNRYRIMINLAFLGFVQRLGKGVLDMNKKIITFLYGFVVPVVLAFILPFCKIVVADQFRSTGYMDRSSAGYLVKDFIINGIWAACVFAFMMWNGRAKAIPAVISDVFMAVCALAGCYIVLVRSDLLSFVRFLDQSTFTLETVLVCLVCCLLIHKIYAGRKH